MRHARTVARIHLWAAAVLAFNASARAVIQDWRFSELFTNASGSVQFIEMLNDFSGQESVAGQTIISTNAAGTQSHTFTFPGDTCTPTQDRHILIAASSYALLTGAVPADFVLPSNFLFPAGGTLNYGPGIQAITYPALPTDGFTSFVSTGYTSSPPYTFTTAPNSPTNCIGSIGSINAPSSAGCEGDLNGDGARNTADLGLLLGVFGHTVAAGSLGDLNNDGVVNTADLGVFLRDFGSACP